MTNQNVQGEIHVKVELTEAMLREMVNNGFFSFSLSGGMEVVLSQPINESEPTEMVAAEEPPSLPVSNVYFDVSERTAFLQQTDNPVLKALMAERATPEAPPAPEKLVVPRMRLADGSRNPDWSRAVAPVLLFQDALNNLARMYVITGTSGYADGILDILDAWAVAGSLTKPVSGQAWLQETWAMADAGLAYSVVRDALPESDAKTRAETWLNAVTQTVIDNPGSHAIGGGGSAVNNLLYWRGLAAAIVGVVSDDDAMYTWGTATVTKALEDMLPEGVFPWEMKRGARALRYQHFALKALILTAEVAVRQGDDLYALTVDGKSLHTAVEWTLRATEDPNIVKPYARTIQRFSAWDGLDWAEPYHRRVPSPMTAKHVGKGRLPSGRLLIAPLATLYWYVP